MQCSNLKNVLEFRDKANAAKQTFLCHQKCEGKGYETLLSDVLLARSRKSTFLQRFFIGIYPDLNAWRKQNSVRTKEICIK